MLPAAVAATFATELVPSVECAIVFPESVVAAEATVVAPETMIMVAESAVTVDMAEVTIATKFAVMVEAAEVTIATKLAVMVKAAEVMIAVKFAVMIKVAQAPIITIEATEMFPAREVYKFGAVPPAIERRMQVIEMVPGACANEHAVDKPLRSPVTIRRATKRIIGIVAVRAHRRNIIKAVAWPDLDAN